MDITIDISEVTNFGTAMSAAAGQLQSELTVANQGLLATGMGYAQDNAPVKISTLRGSVHIIDAASPSGGSYGTDLEYAWMREEGGTIVPRNASVLRFEIGGQVIYAKRVTQTGTKYMQRSADQLEPLMIPAYGEAVERTMAAL